MIVFLYVLINLIFSIFLKEDMNLKKLRSLKKKTQNFLVFVPQ